MPERAWRHVALALMVAVGILWWRDCHRPRAGDRADVERDRRPSAMRQVPSRPAGAPGPAPAPSAGERQEEQEIGEEGPPPGPSLREQLAQHWAVRFLTPRPGETLLEYRDRVVPVAQLAIAPQRARVAENRQRFAREAALDAEQERALDMAVQRAADDVKDAVMQAVLSGELLPPRVKASTAVSFARDVLDRLDRANREFQDTLSDEQLAILDESRFDVVEYLVLSTRWEDLLGVVE